MSADAGSAQGAPSALPEIAYYYPEPYWGLHEADWLKTLLLFFDEIAILLPRYMRGRPEEADPALAGPMAERGLLRVLEPETFVDEEVTQALATAMVELITVGAFDDLPRSGRYAELSRTRLGWDADIELAQMLVDELQTRGLARPTEDGVSVPLHPTVRTTILVLLAQLLRGAGRRAQMDLHPVTDSGWAVDALVDTLSSPGLPSAGQVISLDLQEVAVDISSVPLDDVLAFRTDHGLEYRAYMRRLREFLAQLASIDDEVDRARALADRKEELEDEAERLRRSARGAIRRPLAGFALGIAGSAWTAATQDPLGGALAIAGFLVAGLPNSQDRTAYSYIFAAERSLRS